MIKYPLVSGIILPFKIYSRCSINIRKSAKLIMDGRLTIGPPNSSFANVSALPANIYVGYNAKVVFGESISVGPGVNIIVKDNASLEVGAGTYFTSDMHVEVVNSVKIGKQCAIAWGTSIIDADHHKIHYGSYHESSKNDIVSK